jgi:hypothetical protein
MLYTVSIKYEYYNVYNTAGRNNFYAAWFWVPTQLINFANNALAISDFYLLLPIASFLYFSLYRDRSSNYCDSDIVWESIAKGIAIFVKWIDW